MIERNEWQWGKKYKTSQNGDVFVRREYGVSLGESRVFMENEHTMYDKPVLYYAERKYRSIVPFRAPVIWWRRFDERV